MSINHTAPYPEWPLIQVARDISESGIQIVYWTVRADLQGDITEYTVCDDMDASGHRQTMADAMAEVDEAMAKGLHLPGVVESLLLGAFG